MKSLATPILPNLQGVMLVCVEVTADRETS